MSEFSGPLATSIGGIRIDLVLEGTMMAWRQRIAVMLGSFIDATPRPPDVRLRIHPIARLEPPRPDPELRSVMEQRLRTAMKRHPRDPSLEEWCSQSLDTLDHYRGNQELTEQLAAACTAPPQRSTLVPIAGGWFVFDWESLEGRVFVASGPVTNPARVVLEACCLCCALMLPEKPGLLVHATGLVRGGRAYLFVGPSGAGKSTIAQLSTDAHVLSDDGVVLRQDQGGFHLEPSPLSQLRPAPWPGTLRTATSAPLAAVLFLHKGSRVFLEPVVPAQAAIQLFSRNTHYLRFFPQPALERCLDLCSELCRSLPTFELHFRRDLSFWSCIDEQLLGLSA